MAERKVRGHHTAVKPGDVFGRLTVEKMAPGKWRTMAHCRCECGGSKVANPADLTSGKTRSCGCLRQEVTGDRCRTHGEAGRRLYHVWAKIKERTSDPNCKSWKNYGGRGITMHPAWCDDYAAFRDYVLTVLGGPPSRANSIDRMNNALGYVPGNLRLATPAQQSRNQRRIITVEVSGERMCLKDACARLHRDYMQVYGQVQRARHRGITPQEVIDRYTKACNQ
jgi:hypothetical protein